MLLYDGGDECSLPGVQVISPTMTPPLIGLAGVTWNVGTAVTAANKVPRAPAAPPRELAKRRSTFFFRRGPLRLCSHTHCKESRLSLWRTRLLFHLSLLASTLYFPGFNRLLPLGTHCPCFPSSREEFSCVCVPDHPSSTTVETPTAKSRACCLLLSSLFARRQLFLTRPRSVDIQFHI